MKANIKGRLRNTPVHANEVLMPLFECIVNSIQSIEASKTSDGKIIVRLLRDGNPELDLEATGKEPVNSVEITDNGVGFNSENFDSFNTEDSEYKFSIGGKGVGRFTWLVVFKAARVDSTFSENGQSYRRTFEFLPKEPGVHEEKIVPAGTSKYKTTIRLTDIQKGFRFPKKAQTIAERIFEHFFVFLLSPNCPTIEVHDSNDVIDVNSMMGSRELLTKTKRTFKIGDSQFAVTLIKLYGAPDQHVHKVFLCANDRQVEFRNLRSLIPSLPPSRIPEDDGERDFVCLATISSEYLDRNVNPERTALLISDTEELFEGSISRSHILAEFKTVAEDFLSASLIRYFEEKTMMVRSFVESSAPQYRALLSPRYSTFIQSITSTESDEKLENELHKIKYQVETEARSRVRELSSRIIDEEEYSSFQDESAKLLDEVTELSKSALAEYIVHRKLILTLFEKKLRLRDDDRYELEKVIHDVIYPLHSESDEIDYQRHNLWMIDERLSYHKYLASDMRFDQMREIESDGSNRPDIVIFNGTSALVENESLPYNSIVILEFKRPMRKGYPEDERPVNQVYKYIRDIKDGKATDKNGRPILLGDRDIPYFCYILCDITAKVKENAADAGLTLTPDSQGYFGYNAQHGAYVEIISYDKLLNDSKKRNQILFNKLSI